MKNNILRLLASGVVLALLPGASACAQEVKAGDLVITQAWSRATPSGAKIAGGYLTIENKGSAPDRLVDRKSTRLNSSHLKLSRMPSSA